MRLRPRPRSVETKASRARALTAVAGPGQPVWTPRDYASLARVGYERNVIAYRCVRLIAEAAASAPIRVCGCAGEAGDHPVARLLAKPNPAESGAVFLETLYGFLQTAGNAYIEAAMLDGVVRELYALRPDRIKLRIGSDGWVDAYEYTVGARKAIFRAEPGGFSPILHMKLFHPTNDHYGFSPLEAAAAPVDLHNAALGWNKALIDNSARPSGALVYKGPEGAESLTAEQFDRLKSELAETYTGARNAGRPLVLDGGLDWKAMSLSPADMDFEALKNGAAREIALAFGVPPMLLGIPGDNTYANYREANLAFWKQTVLPLVKKTASAIANWLDPVFPGVNLSCDAGALEALSADRDALWARVSAAAFLSDDEKRSLLGLPLPGVRHD